MLVDCGKADYGSFMTKYLNDELMTEDWRVFGTSLPLDSHGGFFVTQRKTLFEHDLKQKGFFLPLDQGQQYG